MYINLVSCDYQFLLPVSDGDDYAGGSYTVVLGPEANAQECTVIGIVVDGIFEDVENFDTSLSPGETENVVVGPEDTTVVLIDDLSMCA